MGLKPRLSRVISLGIALGATVSIGLTWLGVLPRVVPKPTAMAKVPNGHPKAVKRTNAPSVSAAISGPPYAVQYSGNDLLQLHQLSRQLHWQPWLPAKALQLEHYVEAYTSGPVLSVIVGPYVVEESNAPLTERVAPSNISSVTLANGDQGTWWWVPGDGGGVYSLNFRLGSIYVRVAGSSSHADLLELASSFEPLMSLR